MAEEVIFHAEEIEPPFGLLWIGYEAEEYSKGWNDKDWRVVECYRWKKKAKNLAATNAFNWIFTYMKVLEKEFPRLHWELSTANLKVHELQKKLASKN